MPWVACRSRRTHRGLTADVAHTVFVRPGSMVTPTTETREISASGEIYEDARAAIDQKVPEGWTLIAYKVDRS